MKAAGSLPPRECPFCSGELASGESFAEGKTSSVLDLPPLIDGDDESSDEAPILLVTRTLQAFTILGFPNEAFYSMHSKHPAHFSQPHLVGIHGDACALHQFMQLLF